MKILQWNSVLLFTSPFFLQYYWPQSDSFKIVCVLYSILHYKQLCRAQTSANDGNFLQYFATLIPNSFSTKVCLRFHGWCFFFVRKGNFSWTYLLGKTLRRAKILISSVWNKILKIWNTFWANTEVQCSKNYFKTFLPQEAGVFRNTTE